MALDRASASPCTRVTGAVCTLHRCLTAHAKVVFVLICVYFFFFYGLMYVYV